MGPRSPVTTGKVELEDVQGIVRSGYGTLPEAVFLILTIADPASAKAWLASAPVTNAAFQKQIPSALHVALTSGGLRRIGLSEEALASFPAEFKSGMSGDESRTRRLGDLGPSAPQSWTGAVRRTPPSTSWRCFTQKPAHLSIGVDWSKRRPFLQAFTWCGSCGPASWMGANLSALPTD